MGIATLAKNSMRVFCLLFSLFLPLVKTKVYLVETHDDEKHVGSNEEEVVGEDYSHGCWKCKWGQSDDCKTCKLCGSINKKKNREVTNICKLCKKKQKEEKGKERTRKVCKLCAKKKKEQERVKWQCREAWKNEETGILKDCKRKCKKCNPCP